MSAALSRRRLLARLGLGLACLPLLPARRTRAAGFPKRLVCVLVPHGYRPGAWLPPVGPLAGVTLPQASAPLEPFKDRLIFAAGMTNPAHRGCPRCPEQAYGTIFAGGASRPGTDGFWEPNIPTVDQVVAAGLNQTSVALQVRVDTGKYAALGARRCFWSGAERPVTPAMDPYQVARRLFVGAPGDPATYQRLLRERRSTLDYVTGELKRYQARLGGEDRAMVEVHLESLRDVERTLMGVSSSAACPGANLGSPLDPLSQANFGPLIGVQMKLMVMALRCGVTRVATLQIGDATGSGVNLDLPGVPRGPGGDWESIARSGVAGGADGKAVVDKFMMAQLADLLGQLQNTPEGAGTMLDNCVVLWASPVEDGATRNTQRVPWLLAGSCGGYFKTGQVADSAGKPLNGVLAEICNAMGVPVASFGDPSFGAPMAGLKA